VITGDVFVGRFARLRDVWLDPAPVLEEVQVERFIGRQWLLAAVDRFRDRHDRGYLVVQAEAGLGKTMFAAWLAHSRGWICHFTRGRKGRFTATALRNLAAQLIARYELTDLFAPGGMLPDAAGEPGWFDQVLRAAADAARAAGTQVVLVVDGLDEAEHVGGDLPLGLPATLPRGVFVVATCRTGTELPALRRPFRLVTIEARDRNNTEDLRQFLEATAARDTEISALLAEAAMPEGDFVTALLVGCGGVWVYLRYVLDELRLGLRELPGIGTLPEDLVGYYTESLLPGDSDTDWAGLRLPVLATLAAAAEPLPVARVAAFAALPDVSAVAGLCARRLRPFLAVTYGPDGEPRYSVYHVSLRDYLAGAATVQWDADGARARELAAASAAAHGRIADHYLTALGGLPQLPTLAADPKVGQLDEGYALRYLTLHLEQAQRFADLHQLLEAERPNGACRHVWYAAHDESGTSGDFMTDLERARGLVAAEVDRDLQAGRLAGGYALELHYTLVAAAVTTLTESVPPALIGRLVASGRWTLERGLAHARRTREPQDRALTLAHLLPQAAEADRPELLAELCTTATAVSNPYQRPWLHATLVTLLPDLPTDELAVTALEAAAETPDDDDRGQAIARLAKVLPDSLLPQALGTARTIQDPQWLSWALSALAPRLSGSLLRSVMADVGRLDGYDRASVLVAMAPRLDRNDTEAAIGLARQVASAEDRAWTLAKLAADLDRPELTIEALTEARAADDPAQRAWAIAATISRLDDSERERAIKEARVAANAAIGLDHVWALWTIANALPEAERSGIAVDALAAATALEAEPERAVALANVAGVLDSKSVELLLSTEIRGESDHVTLLKALAGRLPEASLRPILDEALRLSDETHRGDLLAALTPRLPVREMSEALAALARFTDAQQRSQVVSSIAEHLPDKLLGDALGAVQSINGEYGRSRLLGRVAAYMRPPLASQLQHDALDAARRVPFEFGRAKVLAELASLMPNSAEILAEAARTALTMAHSDGRLRLFDELAPQVDEPLRTRMLTAFVAEARDMDRPEYRANWLVTASRHFSEPDRTPLLAEAAENAREIKNLQINTEEKILVLADLAVHLSDNERSEFLDRARQHARSMTTDTKRPVRIALNAAAILPDALIVRAIRLAREISLEHGNLDAAQSAGGLVRLVPTKLQTLALDAARTDGQASVAIALSAIALYLPDQLRERALNDALAMPHRLLARQAILRHATARWGPQLSPGQLATLRNCLNGIGLDDCVGTVAAGADLIQRVSGPDALAAALTTMTTIRRWWPQPDAPTDGSSAHQQPPAD
jgi:hypothetical protein